jgi:hypothetical protein
MRRNCYLQVASAFLLLSGLSVIYPAASTSQDISHWLNGKWEGTPPRGGTLQMALEVVDDKIKGSGIIRGGGHKAAHPSVSGALKGNRVTFETVFPKAQGTVRYSCVPEGKTLLTCSTRQGYETTFKKVDTP